jgi:hypothetical protein
MEHRDEEVSDIVIVIKAEFAERLEHVVNQLKEAGVEIDGINDDVGTVEGNIESNRVYAIQQLEFVDAVRTTFSYIADYPPGDPRDQDGVEDDDE